MTDVLLINVNGIPGAQGSKKGFAVKKGGKPTGKVAMVESSAKVKPWRSDVKAAAEHATGQVAKFDPWTPYAGPVHATITFRFARPASHYRTGRNAHLLRDQAPTHPIGRNLGDVDKLVRSTFDALTAAGVVVDDSLFARVLATKVWCEPGEVPGAHIMIRPLTRPAQAVA